MFRTSFPLLLKSCLSIVFFSPSCEVSKSIRPVSVGNDSGDWSSKYQLFLRGSRDPFSAYVLQKSWRHETKEALVHTLPQ